MDLKLKHQVQQPLKLVVRINNKLENLQQMCVRFVNLNHILVKELNTKVNTSLVKRVKQRQLRANRKGELTLWQRKCLEINFAFVVIFVFVIKFLEHLSAHALVFTVQMETFTHKLLTMSQETHLYPQAL